MPLPQRLVCVLFFVFCLSIILAEAVADEKPRRISIATWNLEWFYDYDQGDNFSDLAKELSAPSKAEWEWRVEGVAAVIAEMNPTIIALQEVENRRVLFDLRNKLHEKHSKSFKIAYIEGFDPFTEQDVAFMFQSGLVEFSMKQQSEEMYDSNQFRNLSKHVFARFEWGEGLERESLTIGNVHLKATAESAETRNKQTRLLKYWLNDERSRSDNVIAIGDFNTETDCETPGNDSEIGILRGLDTRSKEDDLEDLHVNLPLNERATHISGKQFDRILVSQSLVTNQQRKKDLVFKSIQNFAPITIQKNPDRDHRDGYYKIPQQERDLSDHYPIMATFEFK